MFFVFLINFPVSSGLLKARISALNSDLILTYCLADRKVLMTTVDVALENIGSACIIAEIPSLVVGIEQGW